MRREELVARLATITGMASDADLASLAEWSDMFLEAGHSAEAIIDAARSAAMDGEIGFRTTLLRALASRLRRSAASRRLSAYPETPNDSCGHCSGSGRVIVPGKVSESGEVRTTAAVLCRCPIGRAMVNTCTNTKGEPQMTLAEYERERPDWRELMEAHRERQRRYAAAVTASESMDRTLGSILGKIGRMPGKQDSGSDGKNASRRGEGRK